MKKSLIATIAVIVILSVGGYYLINLKQGPYPVSSFDSFTYQWGIGDTLVNGYQSATGEYQYLDHQDSLIKTKVKLKANDLIFIHNKLNEFGFWQLPDEIGVQTDPKAPVYKLKFNYKEKSKQLIIHSDFNDNPLLLDSAMRIKNMLQKVIDDAEDRYHN